MQKNLIITLLFSILIAMFAILNAAPIPVNFIFAKVQLSAALVILISAALGALVIYSVDMLSRIKTRKQIKHLDKQLEEAKQAYGFLKAQYDDLIEAQKSSPEEKERGIATE